jgi:hypothetical protein
VPDVQSWKNKLNRNQKQTNKPFQAKIPIALVPPNPIHIDNLELDFRMNPFIGPDKFITHEKGF